LLLILGLTLALVHSEESGAPESESEGSNTEAEDSAVEAHSEKDGKDSAAEGESEGESEASAAESEDNKDDDSGSSSVMSALFVVIPSLFMASTLY